MRLPYGIKCQYTTTGWNPETHEDTVEILDDEVVFIEPDIYNAYLYGESTDVDIENIKPYLRPMSSMTEKEKEELWLIGDNDFGAVREWYKKESIKETGTPCPVAFGKVDFCNKNHFDFRGLIEKGLALEAPEGMYK